MEQVVSASVFRDLLPRFVDGDCLISIIPRSENILASSLFRPRRFTLVVFGGVFYWPQGRLSATAASSGCSPTI